MNWQIRTLARSSDHSGRAFAPGDRVTSIICAVDGEEEVRRVDLLSSELEGFELAGPVLGRWTRVIKEPDADGDPSLGPDLQSAEEFFLSLFNEEESGGDEGEGERNALKHLLALALERRRILKRLGAARGEGTQTYRFVKRDEEVTVPVVDVEPSLLLKLTETLGDLFL